MWCSKKKMLILRYGCSTVIERTIFIWENMASTDLALTPPRDQHGQGTFWCKCTQAVWHDSPPRPARSILATCIFPCCLQPSCTADKMRCVNKMIVGTTRTQCFVRGKWGKAGQEISQPSVFCQESNVKYFKQLCFLGDAAPRNTATSLEKYHRDKRTSCWSRLMSSVPLTWGRWIDWWIQGRMTMAGQFGCHASEMPLKGKRWEFAQLEKNSKFPFPYKVALTKYANLN